MKHADRIQFLKSSFSLASVFLLILPSFAAFNFKDSDQTLLAQSTSQTSAPKPRINHNSQFLNSLQCTQNSNISNISFEASSFTVNNSTLSSHYTSDLNNDNNVDLSLISSDSPTINNYWGTGTGNFSSSSPKNIPTPASSIISSDLNNDNSKDLIVLSKTSNSFSILLNKEQDFQPAITFNGLSSPSQVSIGDINNDRQTDIFVLDNEALYLYLNFNNSNIYSFGFPLRLPFIPTYFSLADLNYDGNLDIICTDSTSKITILYGNGGIHFDTQSTISLNSNVSSFSISDLNNDKILDLIVSGSNQIGVIFGNSSNEFDDPIYLNLPGDPLFINTGNLNTDCYPDIILVNNNKTFSILKNNGDKSFSPSIEFLLPANPLSLSTTDLNNDLKTDLVFSFPNEVKIYLTSTESTPETTADAGTEAKANTSSSTNLPINCVNSQPVCPNNGTPQCQAGGVPFCGMVGPIYRYGCVINSMIVLDGVTCPQTNTSSSSSSSSGIIKCTNGALCQNGFKPNCPTDTIAFLCIQQTPCCINSTYNCKSPNQPACIPEVSSSSGTTMSGTSSSSGTTMSSTSSSSGTTMSSTSSSSSSGSMSSTSSTSTTSSSSSSGVINTIPFKPNYLCLNGIPFRTNITEQVNFPYNPYGTVYADFNNDQILDFATSNESDFSVFISNETGYERITQNSADANYLRFVGKINHDNITDVLALSNSSNLVFLKGDLINGRYLSSKFKEYNLNPFKVLTADVDKDGNKEIFLLTYEQNTVMAENKVTIISGNDYTSTSELQLSSTPTSFASGDFNKDTIQDIVTLDSSKKISTFFGRADGSFDNPIITTDNSLNNYSSVIKGDFTMDGNLDLAIRYFSQSNTVVNIYQGNGDGTFEKIKSYTYPFSAEVYTKDLNRDNKLDLILSGIGSVTVAPAIYLASGNGDGTFSNTIRFTQNLLIEEFLDTNEDSKVDLITRTPAYQTNITQKLIIYKNVCLSQNESSSSSGGTSSTSSSSGSVVKPCLNNFPYYDSPDKALKQYYSLTSFLKGDFNGDGKLDIALAGRDNYLNNKKGIILYNTGNGFTQNNFDNGDSSATNDNDLRFLSSEDLNNDNIADLITGTAHLGFKVFQGQSNNTFTQRPSEGGISYENNYGSYYMSGGNVNEVFVGDLDGDNYKDIIYQSGAGLIIHSGSGSQIRYEKSILLNFASALIGIKDFNNDGKGDLIINRLGLLYVLLSKGNFNFDPESDNPTANNSTIFSLNGEIATGDFNKDNKNDIAITGGTSVTVLYGNGNGSFTKSTYPLGDSVISIKAEDIDKDTNLDLVFNVAGSKNVLVLINNGNKTFTRYKDQVLESTFDFIIGNYSGNNKPDLVEINLPNSYQTNINIYNNYLCMTLGNNSTTTSSSSSNGGGSTTTSSGNIGEHTNNICPGNQPFGWPRLLYTGYTPGINKEDIVKSISLVSDDFNNDNVVDFAVTSTFDYDNFNKIDVIFGNPNNTFDAPIKIEPNYGGKLISGDFNNDMIQDIASAGTPRAIYLGMNNSTFTKVALTGDREDFESNSIASGDFNGDGKDDLAVSYPGPWGAIDQSFIKIFTNLNNTQTISPEINGARIIPAVVKAANLNNDNYSDLIVLARDTQAVFSYISNMGSFTTSMFYRHYFNASDIEVKDLNNDDIEDIVIAGFGIISVFLGTGNGNFNDNATIQNGRKIDLGDNILITSVTAADYTGDGAVDLAVNNTQGAEYLLLIGKGDGTFENPIKMGSGNLSPQQIISLDLDSDNKKDLALINNDQYENYPQGNKLALFKNGNCSGGFLTPPNVTISTGISKRLKACIDDTGLAKYPNRTINHNLGEDSVNITSVSDNDFNGDGKKDFAVAYNSITLTGAIGNPTESSYEAAILLNNNWNSFGIKKINIPLASTGENPASAILSSNDLNNDNKNDLIINTPDGVSIYPGNGNATFGNAQIINSFRTNVLSTIPTPQTDYPGLAVFSPGMDSLGNYKLSIYSHDMSMNSNPFTLSQTISIGGNKPLYIVSRDFNLDSRADLIISTESGTLLLLRKGDGDYDSFTGNPTANSKKIIGETGENILTYDFNLDSKLDLALIRNGSFSIFLGDGTGSFTKKGSTYIVPKQSEEFKQNYNFADINDDNIKDLVFNNRYGNLVIYRGVNDGTFSFVDSYRQGENGAEYWFDTPFIDDTNNDGKNDLISLGSRPVVNMGLYFNKGIVGIYYSGLCGDDFMIIPPSTTTSSTTSSSSGSTMSSSSSSSSGGITCSPNQVICNNMCISGNCCSNAQCSNGKVCSNNSCTCPTGQLFCNGGCIVGNCCNNSQCANGETCQANTCTSPVATPTYGFTDTFTDTLEVTGSATDSQNNIYVVGSGKLRKISPSGVVLWQKNIVSQNIASINSVNKLSTDKFNNLYLTGTFSGANNFNPGGNDLITCKGAFNAYISKFLPNGNYAWTKTIGGTSTNSQASVSVNDIANDTIGNIYITGSFDNTTDFDPSGETDTKYSPDESFYVTRINKDGSYGWTNISTKSPDYYAVSYTKGLDITTDCSNNIYVTGSYSGKVKVNSSNAILSQGTGPDLFVSSFNNNGVFKWIKTFNEPDPVNNSSVKGIIGVDNNGEVTVVRTDMTTHLSTSANELWSKNISGNDLTVDGFGNIYDVRTEQNGGQSYSPQIRIDSFDPDGNSNWSRYIGKVSNSSIEGFTISTDSNNDVILGGTYSGSFDFDFTNGSDILTSMGLTFGGGYFTLNPFITKIVNDDNVFIGQSMTCSAPIDMSSSSSTSGSELACLDRPPSKETEIVYPSNISNQPNPPNTVQWSVNTGTAVNALVDPSLDNYISASATNTSNIILDIENLPTDFGMVGKVRLDLAYEINNNKDLMIWSKSVSYTQNQNTASYWNNAKLELRSIINTNGDSKNYNIQANLLLPNNESIDLGHVYETSSSLSNYITKIYSAKITFIKDGGNITANNGLFNKVNEGLPANNNNFIHNEGGGFLYLNLSNTPADFASVDSISYNIVHMVSGNVNYALYRGNELSQIAVGGGTGGSVSQWTRLDLGGNGNNWLPSGGNGGIPNTKAIWDDAKILINVDGFADISTIQVSLIYNKNNGTQGNAILRPDNDGSFSGCWTINGTASASSQLLSDCSSNSDCSFGQVCTNSTCSCPTGKLLVNGSCITGNCTANSQCTSGQICSNYSCDCPNGKVLVGNSCITGNCTANSQCTSGQICSNYSCDCPNGKVLVGNSCITGNCTTNSQCTSGQICSNYSCNCPTGKKLCNGSCIPTSTCCNSPNSCTSGQVCSGAGGTCSCPVGKKLCNGNCIPSSSCCNTPNDCTGGQVCNGNAGSCNCPNGQILCNGICTPGNCCNNSNCPNGQICTSNTCECSPLCTTANSNGTMCSNGTSSINSTPLAGVGNFDLKYNYGYVLSRDPNNNGLLNIFNISNPRSIVKVSSLEIGSNLSIVKATENYAFIAQNPLPGSNSNSAMLFVINTTNKQSPQISGSITIKRARQLSINGNNLFISNYDSTISLYDISRPYSPTLVNTINTEHDYIYTEKNLVFATRQDPTTSNYYIDIYKISTSPIFTLGKIKTLYSRYQPEIKLATENYVYYYGNQSSSIYSNVYYIDINIPSLITGSQTQIARVQKDSDEIAASGDNLYILYNTNKKLEVKNIISGISDYIFTQAITAGNTLIKDGYAFVAVSPGITVYNVNNCSGNTSSLLTCNLSCPANKVLNDSNTAFSADRYTAAGSCNGRNLYCTPCSITFGKFETCNSSTATVCSGDEISFGNVSANKETGVFNSTSPTGINYIVDILALSNGKSSVSVRGYSSPDYQNRTTMITTPTPVEFARVCGQPKTVIIPMTRCNYQNNLQTGNCYATYSKVTLVQY